MPLLHDDSVHQTELAYGRLRLATFMLVYLPYVRRACAAAHEIGKRLRCCVALVDGG